MKIPAFLFIAFSVVQGIGFTDFTTPLSTENISGYPIVGTNQSKFFNTYREISKPSEGEAFYGQDANYNKNNPEYKDNGDGTVSDLVTGLMWEKAQSEMTWEEAFEYAKNANTGGYNDWRVPTIKELYSLIQFTGNQGRANPSSPNAPADAVPFIDTDFFEFYYPSSGRYIDVQFVSTTEYGGTAIGNNDAFFGLNLADGRIKAYPKRRPHKENNYMVRLVRGNPDYGKNDFADNGDGTISDHATGLMWCKFDSGNELFSNLLNGFTNKNGSMNWKEALQFCENMNFAGYDDWRLPDAKELQSIVDYSRCPDVTESAAIDPVFELTSIQNEAGQNDYPGFWSSTTFEPGRDAIVIFFGRAMGYFDKDDPLHNRNPQFIDVHGAGAQRTDPKEGNADYGHGPQGDVRRIYNYVRFVRNI